MKTLAVYNLEFPAYVYELNISGYIFKRTADYKEAFSGLQHIIRVSGGEFPINLNTGTHQVTATVEIPDTEESCILPWVKESKFSKLQDILLLLSLFTGRNVFALNPGEEKFPLRPDPRGHFWGGQFRLSTYSSTKWKNGKTGEIKTEDEIKGIPIFDWHCFDDGIEKTINEILNLIISKDWTDMYANGYFIFTFRQAIKQSDIEVAFLLCWTIWEHLFTLHNRKWMDDASIEQTNGEKKISFVLYKYFGKIIDDFARSNIKRLVRARNRLMHFGTLSEAVDIEEMQMFIRLTEQIMSMILNLQPSNVLNSIDSLESFLIKK